MSSKRKATTNKGVKKISTEIKEISQQQIDLVDKFVSEEMPKEAEAIESNSLSVTNEDKKEVAEIKKSGNVEQYINLLRTKLGKINELKSKIETEKTDWTDKNKKLAEKEEKLNKKEAELTIQQGHIDRGEYSSVISDIVNSLRDTEEKITNSTKELVTKLGSEHESYLKELESLYDEKKKLADEKNKFTEEQHKFELSKKHNDAIIKANKDKAIDEAEDEYINRISDLESENEDLNRKIRLLEKDKSQLANFKKEVMTSFDCLQLTPEQLVNEQKRLKQDLEELQNKLNELPSSEEYSNKLSIIKRLQNEIEELNQKINNKELAELELSLQNSNKSIIEINNLKATIDSYKVRERRLQQTIDDLRSTIDLLKEDEKAKNGAFEKANAMDSNKNLENDFSSSFNHPNGLNEIVSYLQTFMANQPNHRFYYDKKTIRTFLAGLNMSMLSILQGISGTGKTSLPREIAKALVAGSESYKNSQDKPYRICAIQSGWRDNMDLMGFYNNFEKKYKETDFFLALYLAAQPKYQNTLFLIILDEMNLSHPEHYFADFLSLMEQSEDDRYIKINASIDIQPKLFKEGQMLLPRNVRFIGTANHDETTLDFAPKTYDRSNVMVMKTNEKEKVIKEIGFTKNEKKYSIDYEWLHEQFKEAEKTYSEKYKKFEEFIHSKDLQILLSEKGIGIGNRFDEQAKKFICSYIALGDDNDKCLAEAADHLITSRLFRTLKNRYEIDSSELKDFKDQYDLLFKDFFSNDPEDGDKLLQAELDKKQKEK